MQRHLEKTIGGRLYHTCTSEKLAYINWEKEEILYRSEDGFYFFTRDDQIEPLSRSKAVPKFNQADLRCCVFDWAFRPLV